MDLLPMIVIEDEDEVSDDELAARLDHQWAAQNREAVERFTRAWDAHAAMIRRRNHRVAILTNTKKTR